MCQDFCKIHHSKSQVSTRFSGLCRSCQRVHLVVWSISRLQSSLNILPEDSSMVAPSLRPAQVGLPLLELPHAVVGGELVGWELLQEQKDQNILLLIEETKAAGESRSKGLWRLAHKDLFVVAGADGALTWPSGSLWSTTRSAGCCG